MATVQAELTLAPVENASSPECCRVSQELALRAESERGLVLLAEAERALAATSSFDEIKNVRDKAETVRVLARAANLNLELQNKAAELKLRAERKAGEVLQNLKLRGGDRKSNRRRSGLKLIDLGITEDQSRRWQKEALVPEGAFCRYVAAAYEEGREITVAGLLKLVAGSQANRRSAQRSASQDVALPAVQSSDQCSLKDNLSDLREHHRLLTDVLQPVCDGVSTLAPHSRRIVRYLLTEIATLLNSLADC